jgi:hypothetical protein
MGTLVVDSGNVRLEPAADLLGLDPASTSEAVRTRLGSGFRSPRSARPASAASATRPSPTTAAWPGGPGREP